MEMTRAEHLAWAKKRAIDELDRGSVINAISSMLSDLDKHDDLQNHVGKVLFVGVRSIDQARRWIEGFN